MEKRKKFDRQVATYEKLRESGKDFTEFRKALLRDVHGDVLEIAPGPGFNFPYYTNINTLTAVDLSPKMTESAEKAWRKVSGKNGTFIASDIMDMQFAENSFDTVVSTCSLCAYDDPIAVLNKLAKWCKPDGTVYLLEHGLSDHSLIRVLQRLYKPIHYLRYACHCNRDVRDIVERSNLKITSIKNPNQFAVVDFMYSIVAKPEI